MRRLGQNRGYDAEGTYWRECNVGAKCMIIKGKKVIRLI